MSSQPQVLIHLLLDISCIRQFHHYAERLRFIIKKRLSIVDDVGMRNRRKYSNFIECVLSFLLPHLSDFDLDGGESTFFMA